MDIFKKVRHLFTLAAIMALVISLSACARKKEDKNVLATINDYNMTLEDFNYEANKVLNIGRVLGEIPITKDEVLDLLITKEVLLQEAAKQNLDKDNDFINSIELYWEQTLLKNLMTRKLKEIEAITTVYDSDILAYYNKMKYKIKAAVIVFTDKKQARKVMQDGKNALEVCMNEPKKYFVSYVIPSRWYVLGESESVFEKCVFEINPLKSEEIIDVNGKAALIVIEEKVPNDIAPLEDMKEEIRKKIAMAKEKESVDKWISGLRKKAQIKINEKMLHFVN